MNKGLFERASEQKLRFQTSKGMMSTEDLWDLPLSSKTGRVNLDDIAKSVYKKLEADKGISFVEEPAPENTTDQLRLDILKRVINVKKAANEAARLRKEKAEKKQRLYELINQKKDEALAGKSIEELQAMVASL